MISNFILLPSKTIRTIGVLFIKIAQVLDFDEKFKKSKIMKKGLKMNLYKTRFNDFFWLNENKYLDKSIIENGIFEKYSTQIINQLVKKGDFVLDIGANIGYYSVLFSKLVGETGVVFCFEPTEHYSSVLEMNLEANNIQNAEVFKVGLSNKRQKLEIQIGNSSATLHPIENQAIIKEELIMLTTLDDFMLQHKLQKIDLVKIDIDGHEPLFFEGAQKTLDKFNPIVLLEVNHLNYIEAGFSAWDFYDFLKQNHYIIYSEDGLIEFKTKEAFLRKCGNFAYSANIIISRKEIDASKYFKM